ncbi:MMPL family transporter [Flaviflexus equikiangi]|uniref:MMPL family transporter n=1 Tax=Flaviflexus equikiangi TaxID=2758573 RepID=UPI0015F6CCF8|nr:MMPL family transporter [Flaviflexus equikiangi]
MRTKSPTFVRVILLLVWLVIGGLGGMAQGQLSSVQENDQALYLPESAESTYVAERVGDFTDSQSLPVFVVFTTADGEPLTEQQIGILNQRAQAIAEVAMPDGTSLGAYLDNPASAFIPADDGASGMWPISLDSSLVRELDGNGDPIQSTSIEAIRAYVADTVAEVGNLEAATTGPGAIVADLANAFAGIDLVLLLVAVVLVFVILIVVYRSFLLPIIVLTTAIFALCGAGLVVFWLADAGIVVLSAQTQGILSILVIGATTDYCLLIVSRYREELALRESPFEAMKAALRATWEPVVASAATVSAGLFCLLLSDLRVTASLGPVSIIGIVFCVLAAMTLLPTLLLLPGRHARVMFWPAKVAVTNDASRDGWWARSAAFVARNDRRVWMTTAVILLAFVGFVPSFQAKGLSSTDTIVGETESENGLELLYQIFPQTAAAQPVNILAPADVADDVVQTVLAVDGVTTAEITEGESGPLVSDGQVLIVASTSAPSEDIAAQNTVGDIREAVDGMDVFVGGDAATRLDTQQTGTSDLLKVVPVTLVVVGLMLMVLLRSITAPLLVLAANILSFGATLGIAAILFNNVLGWPGSDASVPLYSFIFLVALSIDYTIFLMTRAREESLRHGTRRGIVTAVAVTGGVITSAGLVLAATFAALVVIPLLFMIQLAIIVAMGILIDTFVVRTLLVPGLVHDVGNRVWWPWQERMVKIEAAQTT